MNRAIWTLPLLIPTLAAGAGPSLQPGKWQESVTIVDVQVPSAPAIATSLKGHTTRITTCLTPAQVAQGPHIALSGGTRLCRFTGFSFAGGQMRSTMVCNGRSGPTVTRSSGSYTPTSIDIIGSAATSGVMKMTMKTHTIGHRIGRC